MRRETVVCRGEPRSLVYVARRRLDEIEDELNDELPERELARTCRCEGEDVAFWAIWLLPGPRPLGLPRLLRFLVPIGDGVLEEVSPEKVSDAHVELAFEDMGSDRESARLYAAWARHGVDVALECERRLRRGLPTEAN